MFQTIWVLNLSFKATKLKTNEWEKFFQKIDWFGVKPMLTIPLESKVCEKGEIKTLPFPLWPFLDICLCLVLRLVKMIYNGKFKKNLNLDFTSGEYAAFIQSEKVKSISFQYQFSRKKKYFLYKMF